MSGRPPHRDTASGESSGPPPTARPGPTGRTPGPTGRTPGPADSRIRAALWSTIPAALATELGALTVIAAGAVAGIVVGIAGVVVLHLALGRVVPGSAAVRAVLLIGGPPLRYALVIVAVWFEWVVRGSGPWPALAAGVLLAVVVPMVGGVLASPRARGGRT